MQNVSKTHSFLQKSATYADLDGSSMKRDAKRDAPRPTKTPNCATHCELLGVINVGLIGLVPGGSIKQRIDYSSVRKGVPDGHSDLLTERPYYRTLHVKMIHKIKNSNGQVINTTQR